MRGNRISKSYAVLFLLLVLGWLLARPALVCSQNIPGSIDGRVVDPQGLPIAGAIVTLRSTLSGETRQQVTTTDGRFSFERVDRAYYNLAVSHPQFSDQIRLIQFASGKLSHSEAFQLRVAGISQVLTVVSGSRVEELQQESPIKVDVVTLEQLRDTGYERVSDALSEIPGVVIRSGSSASVGAEQIDGIDSRQVLVLQDGLPIIGARGIKSGVINLNRQSIGKLQRVEVARGAASALYGSEAIGGVINMITREPSQPVSLDLSLSGGSLGAVDGRVDLGARWKKLTFFTDLESHRQDSYGLIPGDPSTVGPDWRRNDVLAKLRYAFNERVALGLAATAYHNHQTGLANTSVGLTTGTSNDSVQSYALTGDFLLTNTTTLQTRAYAARYDENSQSQIANGSAPPFGLANLNERYKRLDASLSQQIGERQFLQGGIEWAQDLYRGVNRLVGDNAGQQVTTEDLWLEDRLQPFHNLTITLGGRYQHHSLYGGHFVPRVALMYRVSDHWSVRGSLGKGFRAPDLGQLYYRFANPASFYQVIGNPNLRPETSRSFLAGINYQQRRYRLELNLYRHDLNNLIDSYAAGTPQTAEQLAAMLQPYGIPLSFNPLLNRLTFIYLNLKQASTEGFTFNGDVAITSRVRFEGAYTFLQAVDSATGLLLPQRHRHQGYVKVAYSDPRRGLFMNIRGTFFSKWALNPSLGTYAYGYRIWDLAAAKDITTGLQAFVAIDNLMGSTDAKLRNPVPSFDRPDYGRTFRIGMRYSLARREKQ